MKTDEMSIGFFTTFEVCRISLHYEKYGSVLVIIKVPIEKKIVMCGTVPSKFI